MSWFKKYRQNTATFIIVVIGIFLLAEVARDVMREGDFGGYISTGQLAFNGDFIYSDFRNTWPPFFSIFSIPLYALDSVSFYGLRLVWLTGILVAYYFIFRSVIQDFIGKQLVFKFKSKNPGEIGLTHHLFLAPFLLSFRILLEEVSNLQINIFLLGASLVVLHLIQNNKKIAAGLLLGFIISLKVYPIFIFLFLIFKKEFKAAGATLLGIGLCTATVFLYFGYNEGIELFKHWNTAQVSGVNCEFKNHSLWGFLCGLFSGLPRMAGVTYNIFELNEDQVKLASVSVFGMLGTLVGYRFWVTKTISKAFSYQYIILLSLIPLLSPLAWKYYFVFVAPLIILLYERHKNTSNKWLFYIPVLAFLLTSEMFIGGHFSDVTEALGVTTLCSLFLSLLATFTLLPKQNIS